MPWQEALDIHWLLPVLSPYNNGNCHNHIRYNPVRNCPARIDQFRNRNSFPCTSPRYTLPLPDWLHQFPDSPPGNHKSGCRHALSGSAGRAPAFLQNEYFFCPRSAIQKQPLWFPLHEVLHTLPWDPASISYQTASLPVWSSGKSRSRSHQYGCPAPCIYGQLPTPPPGSGNEACTAINQAVLPETSVFFLLLRYNSP